MKAHKQSILYLLLGLGLLGTSACGDSGDDDGNSGGLALGKQVCGLYEDNAGSGYVLVADEKSNYEFVSSLMLEETPVAPRSELTFDWSQLTVDFTLHDVDPQADIDMVSLIVWKLSASELAVKLNDDDLSQSDFEAIAMVYPDSETDAKLFSFTEFGVEIDSDLLLQYLDPDTFDPASHAYTIMASTGTTPGKDTRMVKAFTLVEGETNTNVDIHSESAKLDFTVNLSSLSPVEVPVGESDIKVDWSQIAVNAMGAEFDPTSITEVAVGRYPLTASELEDQFLDLDLIADQIYWGEVISGSSFSLAETKTEDGQSFKGIDEGALWLVALRCDTCTNPAPWYMTIMTPCDSSSGGETTP